MIKNLPDISSCLADIAQALEKGRNFFIAVHRNPDGDTLGCALALCSLVKRMKKKAVVFSADPLPDNISFLPGAAKVLRELPRKGTFDTMILMECSTPSRAGDVEQLMSTCGTVINIDHHRTFENYGTLNCVDPVVSSVSELIVPVWSELDMPLTADEATCLYVGIATDTGRFHYVTTTPKTHRIVADLLSAGARHVQANDFIYATSPLSAQKLLGRALENLRVIHGGKTALVVLTPEDVRYARASHQDAEGIVNRGLMLPGIEVSVLIREEADRVWVNLRSKGRIDVSVLARQFGGGGHKNAAGCKMKPPLSSCEKRVLAFLKKLYNDDK